MDAKVLEMCLLFAKGDHHSVVSGLPYPTSLSTNTPPTPVLTSSPVRTAEGGGTTLETEVVGGQRTRTSVLRVIVVCVRPRPQSDGPKSRVVPGNERHTRACSIYWRDLASKELIFYPYFIMDEVSKHTHTLFYSYVHRSCINQSYS